MRKSEDIRRLAFDYANDGIFVHEVSEDGTPGRFLEVNDCGCRMTGYSREEIIGLTPLDIDKTPPETAMAVRDALVRDRRFSFETLLVTKKGEEKPIEISNYLVREKDRSLVIAVVRDITERRQAEKMLKDSRDMFTTVVDGLKQYVYVTTMDTREILFVNRPTREEFGDVVGRTCWEVFSEGRSGPCEDCHAVGLEGEMAPSRLVVREHFNERFGRWYELCDSVIRWVDGKPVRIGFVTDITERRKADEHLRMNEALFRAAFENAAVGASMVGLKGRFIKVNAFFCGLLGYSEEEMLSKTFSEITHPDDVHIGLDSMKRLTSGEADSMSFEKRYVRKDGSLINVIVSPAMIRDGEGRPFSS